MLTRNSMRKKKNPKEKFQFDLEFQEAILQFTLTDSKGYKALKLYDDSHFTLITDSIIAFALKEYYKAKKTIPSRVVLREKLRQLLETPEFRGLPANEKNDVFLKVNRLFQGTIKGGDTILEEVRKFSQYVEFKSVLEDVDVKSYSSYAKYITSFQKAISKGNDQLDNKGIYLVRGAKDRPYQRDISQQIKPTPLWQLNRLLNGGGFSKGNLIMVMAKAKRFKTGILLNLARYYLRRKKVILYADFENGEAPLALRAEQSTLKKTQQEILDGTYDKKLTKIFRRYQRIGSELIIRRFPAYHTTTNDLEVFMDEYYQETGKKIELLICDYGDLMGSTTGQQDETHRISDVYVDLKNLGEKMELEAIFTASHVTRAAEKREGSKYDQNDVAKCIDKTRHCDMILGLQESSEEKDAGVMRLEIVDQRNGTHDGRVLLWVDIKKQHAKEFTRSEVAEYNTQAGLDHNGERKKAEKKSDL